MTDEQNIKQIAGATIYGELKSENFFSESEMNKRIETAHQAGYAEGFEKGTKYFLDILKGGTLFSEEEINKIVNEALDEAEKELEQKTN